MIINLRKIIKNPFIIKIKLGEEFLRRMRDQLTERRENMVWRAITLIDHNIFENSKSYIGKFNSEL